MSWRRFNVLLAGLSAEAIYRHVTRQGRGSAGRPLKAADAAAFFASFPKAGEKR